MAFNLNPVAQSIPTQSTWSNTKPKDTLAGHLAFFDENKDGTVRFGETVDQLKKLGKGWVAAPLGAAFIHAFLGEGISFKIPVRGIEKKKHDSDTDIIGDDGRVDWGRFEEVSRQLDPKGTGKFDEDQVAAMVGRNRETIKGFIASKGEFFLLFSVAGETEIRNGEEVTFLRKETLRAFFADPEAFFEAHAARVANEKK